MICDRDSSNRKCSLEYYHPLKIGYQCFLCFLEDFYRILKLVSCEVFVSTTRTLIGAQCPCAMYFYVPHCQLLHNFYHRWVHVAPRYDEPNFKPGYLKVSGKGTPQTVYKLYLCHVLYSRHFVVHSLKSEYL